MRMTAAETTAIASPRLEMLILTNIDTMPESNAEIIITSQRGSIIVCLIESMTLGTGARGFVFAPKYLFLLKRSLSSPIMPD
jgi:hypothetical protein